MRKANREEEKRGGGEERRNREEEEEASVLLTVPCLKVCGGCVTGVQCLVKLGLKEKGGVRVRSEIRFKANKQRKSNI